MIAHGRQRPGQNPAYRPTRPPISMWLGIMSIDHLPSPHRVRRKHRSDRRAVRSSLSGQRCGAGARGSRSQSARLQIRHSIGQCEHSLGGERFDTGLCHLRQLVSMHGLCAITRSRKAVRRMPETPPRTTPTVVGASCSDRRLTQSLDVGGWPRTKAPVAEDETARTWSRPAPRPRPIPNSCRSCHLHGPARRDWRCWDRGCASLTTQSTASA
jgi:hypothetical protein